MISVAQLGQRVIGRVSCFCCPALQFCGYRFYNDCTSSGIKPIEELLEESLDFVGCADGPHGMDENISQTWTFSKNDSDRVLEVLSRGGLDFNVYLALDKLNIRVSGLLVRDVLSKILGVINYGNRSWSAKASNFFVWSGKLDKYKHTVNAYHLMMKIFADSGEFKAMGRLLIEMIDQGYPVTARTFNILTCSYGKAGTRRQDLKRFIRTKGFNFRQYRHSYNAILHSLLATKQYSLIEWIYQLMLAEPHFSPDILTYNIMMWTKYRLGKMGEFRGFLDEMEMNKIFPDSHTYNILLHYCGRENMPDEAADLLNKMNEKGLFPSVLHFTTLIDGLSRARNLDACEYFFNEMIKSGCNPDVVCYTVMITGYVVAKRFKKARRLFKEMIANGQLPNAYTYNSMIRGLCMVGKFKEAHSMLKEMESRGCNPNFLVYNTLVRNLFNAEKFSEADEVIRDMWKKQRYNHLCSKLNQYRYRKH